MTDAPGKLEKLEKMEKLEKLENEIRRALEPVPMPAGLEEKILAKAQCGQSIEPKAASERNRTWRLAVAAGLTLALLVPVFRAYRDRQAEKGRAQLMFALQLASKKLSHALERAANISRAGVHPSTPEETA
jgi:hypothetical protein